MITVTAVEMGFCQCVSLDLEMLELADVCSHVQTVCVKGNDEINTGALKKVLRSRIFSMHPESNQFHEQRRSCERSTLLHIEKAL